MKFLLNKIAFIILISISLFAFGQEVGRDAIPEKTNPPKLVNDFAGILSENNINDLEEKLTAFNDSSSTQICIVTVQSIGDYSIEDYAVRLGRKWGVGQKDKNNGILITVAKEERKVDIEIGYGLEEHITDYDSKQIIDNIIIPAFKQSNYYKGLDDATDRIIAQLKGTYTAQYDKANANNNDTLPTWAIILIIIFIVLIIISSSGGAGGGISSRGSGWTWSSGGGSSWSGGGSGGFGGFGGGSFGGGGSSGSW